MTNRLAETGAGPLYFSFALSAVLFSGGFGSDGQAEEPDAANAVAKASRVMPVWPSEPPAWDAPNDTERDFTKSSDNKVGGRRLIRLGNVSKPEMHVYPAMDASGQPSKTVMVICPGGGFSILAWDLEGTEIAEQLVAGGVTSVVLKYRVPTRSMEPKWKPPVQDIQRVIALVRAGEVTGQQPEKVGVLGFSAGGHAACRAATISERQYDAVDDADQSIKLPDFACLIYPAWLVKKDATDELDGFEINEQSPPMFLVHGEDDRLTVMNCVTVFTKLHEAGVPSALHVFTGSGHGFGGRMDGRADDLWPELCLRWMRDESLLSGD
ncbi:alpha/beta hydrolase [Rhodopirellula halodulae]|uniref:alpha/beta hydrolase n=1 Tax=Rhodopirellula halodulae TaxID=2894198 RepID=UPI001E527128|nr:alpha/beta hydrolase [Rhodopirellula sp. JC737]MCC9658521.1 alpha/beta hydrolase [Rhodopirellula sp. JC737]